MRRRILAMGVAIAALLGAGQSMATRPDTRAPDFLAWNSVAEFQSGALSSSALIESNGRAAVTLATGAREGEWTSPVKVLRRPADHLTPSWQAETPEGTWIEVELTIRDHGRWSRWYQLGLWSLTDTPTFRRSSVDNQGDSFGTVFTDTFVSASGKHLDAYRVRVVLRSPGDRQPRLHQIAVQASDQKPFTRVSTPTMRGRQLELAVPGFSQYAHSDEFPGYGGGGEAWCSPTSTAMVMAYWGAGPSPAELAALPSDPVFDARGRQDPLVDHAAIHSYDVAYRGTGNWPFNTAYAAAYQLDAAVRVYQSFAALEWWLRRDVPVVVSIAWDNSDSRRDNDLPGAGVPSTPGHLMVVRGVTRNGDVIANDPATPMADGGNAGVRHVYQRQAFERQWIDASGGVTYVIKKR